MFQNFRMDGFELYTSVVLEATTRPTMPQLLPHSKYLFGLFRRHKILLAFNRRRLLKDIFQSEEHKLTH